MVTSVPRPPRFTVSTLVKPYAPSITALTSPDQTPVSLLHCMHNWCTHEGNNPQTIAMVK